MTTGVWKDLSQFVVDLRALNEGLRLTKAVTPKFFCLDEDSSSNK